jgi:hypothetical protein
MVAGTNKSVAYIAFLAVIIPILIAAWFAAPTFMPVYRWLHVDLKAISATSGIPEAQLATEYAMRVRYNPRGEGDPLPWQIISCNPPYPISNPEEDETNVLVRCNFLSGNDGTAPGTTFINNTYKDRYYNVKALRLPPGSQGCKNKRPVVVYVALDFVRMDITGASSSQQEVAGWETDDEWEERDDGWKAPAAAPR